MIIKYQKETSSIEFPQNVYPKLKLSNYSDISKNQDPTVIL